MKKLLCGICLGLLVICTFISCIAYSKHLHKLISHVQPININEYPEESVAGGQWGKIRTHMTKDNETIMAALMETHAEGLKRRLPQAIIIGVQKCGTKALLEMLNMHPQIAAASGEVHYFDNYYDRGQEWYRHRMPYSYPYQITIEKSPKYFVTDEAQERIYRMSRDVKLIVIVRDPTTRAISYYAHVYVRSPRGKDYETFEEMAMKNGEVNRGYRGIKIGIYDQFVKKWLEYFPRKQIHFVDGEKLISNPYPEIKKVERFLGLSDYITSDNFYLNKARGFYCLKSVKSTKCMPGNKGRRHPEVSPYVLEKLREFYRPFDQAFFDRVGRKFDWS